MALAAGAQRYVCTRCGVSRLARTVVALLAVFLVSCAAPSTGRTYRDGVPVERAPVFVTPGYAPAGAGLPEYMPAMERETVPRGTDRRVLPPTREPGIWASDGDETRAALRRDQEPSIFDVLLPLPSRASDREIENVARCARGMTRFLNERPGAADILALTLEERACLAARLYQHCIESTWDRFRREVKAGTMPQDGGLMRFLKRLGEPADAFARKMCSQPLTPRVDAWREEAASRWTSGLNRK